MRKVVDEVWRWEGVVFFKGEHKKRPYRAFLQRIKEVHH